MMKNMTKYRFYKENLLWYVDLPDWQGSKSELQMVLGADTMLEYMAEGKEDVHVYISKESFNGADVLNFVRPATELENGAYYHMPNYKGIDINLNIWLCDVTLFVMGEFPETIFICKDELY